MEQKVGVCILLFVLNLQFWLEGVKSLASAGKPVPGYYILAVHLGFCLPNILISEANTLAASLPFSVIVVVTPAKHTMVGNGCMY